MIRGSCLCGEVRFEVDRVAGPFQLCHCSRCRKACGSAFLPFLGALAADVRFVRGADLVRTFSLPLRERPPAYARSFCGRCASPLPHVLPGTAVCEIPAGLLDDDPGLRPERHIFTGVKAPWYEIADGLPQPDREALAALRARE